MSTSSLFEQLLLLIVQVSVVVPLGKLCTVVFGSFSSSNVTPEVCVLHVPVPSDGVFALSVASLEQAVWSSPALATT